MLQTSVVDMMSILQNKSQAVGTWRYTELNVEDQIQSVESRTVTVELPDAEIDDVSSPTLARLIEEVRNEEEFTAHAYNRLHNRHNRSR